MSITKYSVFVKVAELGSLTRAAEVLGYTQPAVSHSISSLESRFGFPLFYRSRDACVLTENGAQLLDACRQVLQGEERIEETVHALNGNLSGSIRIGALRSMLTQFLPEIVYHFSQAYPQIAITLSELTFQEVSAALNAGTIDVGFTSTPTESGRLRFTPLLEDPVCLILPPDHPFTAYERVPVRLLNGCDFLMPAPGYDDVYQVITDKVRIQPNVKYHVGSDVAAIGMVANRLGVSIMSSQQARFLGSAVACRDFQEDFHRTLGILTHSARRPSPALRAFLQAVQRSRADTGGGCGIPSQQDN